MATGNEDLSNAKKNKKDEFYTSYEDIQKELNNYEEQFKGKTVFCNCDDPFESNFCKFFLKNFNYLKLKRLICTSYSGSKIIGTQMTLFDDFEEPIVPEHGYVMDITEMPMENGRGVSDKDIDLLLHSKSRGVKKLKGNGDFSSKECIKYLKEADIVVTNPPFSLFRDFIHLLMNYNKKFLVIGNTNVLTYKEIFPYFKTNNMRTGFTNFNVGMFFRVPENYEKYTKIENGIKLARVSTSCWVTNLDVKKHNEKLILYKNYNKEEYPMYDNYNAINVDKVKEIPKDYSGYIGVPITFMDKFCPEQFEIIGLLQSSTDEQAGIPNLRYYNDFKEMRQDMTFTGSSGGKANGNPVIKGKSTKGNFLYNPDTDEYVHSVYARVLIRNKYPEKKE